MSRINKKVMISTMEKIARGACPVLPTSKLEEFSNGKLVGRAEGVALLMRAFLMEDIITDKDYDHLNCILSNRSLEDVLAERAQAKEFEEEMAKLEEDQTAKPEQE